MKTKSVPFGPLPEKPNFPRLEEEILKSWRLDLRDDQQNTFLRSVAQRSARKQFVFYDGPPFATGLPHYGHLLQATIKDMVPRYKTMRGYRVEPNLYKTSPCRGRISAARFAPMQNASPSR